MAVAAAAAAVAAAVALATVATVATLAAAAAVAAAARARARSSQNRRAPHSGACSFHRVVATRARVVVGFAPDPIPILIPILILCTHRYNLDDGSDGVMDIIADDVDDDNQLASTLARGGRCLDTAHVGAAASAAGGGSRQRRSFDGPKVFKARAFAERQASTAGGGGNCDDVDNGVTDIIDGDMDDNDRRLAMTLAPGGRSLDTAHVGTAADASAVDGGGGGQRRSFDQLEDSMTLAPVERQASTAGGGGSCDDGFESAAAKPLQRSRSFASSSSFARFLENRYLEQRFPDATRVPAQANAVSNNLLSRTAKTAKRALDFFYWASAPSSCSPKMNDADFQETDSTFPSHDAGLPSGSSRPSTAHAAAIDAIFMQYDPFGTGSLDLGQLTALLSGIAKNPEECAVPCRSHPPHVSKTIP